ncbi:MAG: BrnT family toxin [Rickettsiales bacterium]|nr:BrnT family toxin [Rickettsiales bacterium]
MIYEWDEKKRKANIEKHGLDFALASQIMEADAMSDILDDRFDYGEERHLAYAKVGGVYLCLCYAPKHDDTIRVISLRRAHKKEWRKLK